MKRLIDMACPQGHVAVDVWVDRLDEKLNCHVCGALSQRAWLSAPSITPGGTRPEVNTTKPTPKRVDTKAVAIETTQEIEQKWLRYRDEKVAEEHIRREINEAAGLDKPVPTPTPITFERSAAHACA